MLSKITPLSTKIILLCLPINSTIRCLVFISPSSSKCWISKSIILSRPGCDIFIILPLLICFLRSIQKLGAVSGAVLFVPVKYVRGRLALALISRRYWSRLTFIVRSNSSDSVCAILYILPLRIFLLNSDTSDATVTPSKAIYFLLIKMMFFKI